MSRDRFSRAHPAVSFGFFLAVILLTVMLLHPVYLALSLFGAAACLICQKGRKGLLQTAAMLLIAKTANPELYADVDPQQALQMLTEEATGAVPYGIYYYSGE